MKSRIVLITIAFSFLASYASSEGIRGWIEEIDEPMIRIGDGVWKEQTAWYNVRGPGTTFCAFIGTIYARGGIGSGQEEKRVPRIFADDTKVWQVIYKECVTITDYDRFGPRPVVKITFAPGPCLDEAGEVIYSPPQETETRNLDLNKDGKVDILDWVIKAQQNRAKTAPPTLFLVHVSSPLPPWKLATSWGRIKSAR